MISLKQPFVFLCQASLVIVAICLPCQCLVAQSGDWQKQLSDSLHAYCKEWNSTAYTGNIEAKIPSRAYSSTFNITPDQSGDQIRFEISSRYDMSDGRAIHLKKGSMNIREAVIYAEELEISKKELGESTADQTSSTNVRAK